MKKNNLEVTCKLDRFGYWNSCKSLPKSVNVAAQNITPCYNTDLDTTPSCCGSHTILPWNFTKEL